MFWFLTKMVPSCDKFDTISPIKNKNDLTEIKNDKLVKVNHTLSIARTFY